MALGLGHSLSRFKLKFSTDKVDTMVIQAIALLDDLDKEINIYSMRVKEWFGWHFPEMGKIITDNLAYARIVKAMGFRTNAASTDFSMILPEELEASIKQAAELSMGTEISDTDMDHINSLCDQVISITEYRTQLSEYLRNRMQATALVGELVGARLISHAGSLMNLAKFPASTVQILGAEKALFRALKTKHDTPKYGIIYHASLVGQAPQKLKGKMARMTATKASLSIRVDALSDADTKMDVQAAQVGIENRVKLESRLRALEHRAGIASVRTATSGSGRQQPKFELSGTSGGYNAATDDVKPNGLLATEPETKEEKKDKKKKRKSEAADETMEVDADETIVPGETKEERKARKAAKKAAKAEKEEKKKRRASEAADGEGEKKKKKKRASEAA
jgi:nucleolar protein 58